MTCSLKFLPVFLDGRSGVPSFDLLVDSKILTFDSHYTKNYIYQLTYINLKIVLLML